MTPLLFISYGLLTHNYCVWHILSTTLSSIIAMIISTENGTIRQQMTDVSLNPTDEAILDLLAEGRCTPSYISKETSYSRGNVQNRLLRLTEHGYVNQIGGGLYELIEDPRETD